MPSQTPRGYPYPLPTEPVAEGAQRIRELAEAIEAERIADILLPAGGGPSIDFQNIPTRWTHLRIVALLRASAGGGFQSGTLRFNGNADANYIAQRLRVGGSVISGFDSFNVNGIPLTLCGSTMPGAWATPYLIDIPCYRDPTFYRFVRVHGAMYSAVDVGGINIEDCLGIFQAAQAITRITIAPDAGGLAAGSRATLYGL